MVFVKVKCFCQILHDVQNIPFKVFNLVSCIFISYFTLFLNLSITVRNCNLLYHLVMFNFFFSCNTDLIRAKILFLYHLPNLVLGTEQVFSKYFCEMNRLVNTLCVMCLFYKQVRILNFALLQLFVLSAGSLFRAITQMCLREHLSN